MHATSLVLPERYKKPRVAGLTVLIDNGLPLRYFQDVVESMSEFVDYVKFGWGTAIITNNLVQKMQYLHDYQIDYFFGGTLFEKFYLQGKVDDYIEYCKRHNCRFVEISNGTIEMSNDEKAYFVDRFAKEFLVLSEVGFKESEKSIHLHPAKWVDYIKQDLEAGAYKVITEARESGTSGICRSDGEIRYGLIEEILSSGIDASQLIFEAPNKDLQVYFIGKVGVDVNLANVPFEHALSLETLRLGLRSDTLMMVEKGEVNYEKSR